MKRALILFIVLAFFALLVSGCGTTAAPGTGYNATIFDTKYHFDKAYVTLPNGKSVEGMVQSWKDWDDSDMLQVTFTDGRTFYTHGSNIVLVAER